MSMKKYVLKKAGVQATYKQRRKIEEGCTANGSINSDEFSEVLTIFDNLEEALEALKAYETDIARYDSPIGMLYDITEYFVEEGEYEYDEELEEWEWISGCDIWKFSKMNIEVCDVDTGETIANCSSWVEAEKAVNDYTGETGACIRMDR